jgi:hypothetical protein
MSHSCWHGGKRTKIAADRCHDDSKSVLPAEVAWGVYIENPPFAEALKLMHLMIGRAGGRMAEDVRHELRLDDIKKIEGMRNHSRATLRKLFIELAGAVMVFDDTETQCAIIGGFLDRAKLDYRHEVTDDLLLAWWFGGDFREMAENSAIGPSSIGRLSSLWPLNIRFCCSSMLPRW